MPCRVIVFDVNETLLDLGGLDGPFETSFGDARARSQWFAQLLSLSMTATIVEDYRDFSALARDALEQLAAGCRGAFVARGGTAFPAWAPRPDVCEPGLDGVAEAIIRADG